jgi:hypothetical protein
MPSLSSISLAEAWSSSESLDTPPPAAVPRRLTGLLGKENARVPFA